MQIIRRGNFTARQHLIVCDVCDTTYAYTQYDLKVYHGAWERLDTDCSVRHVKLYVECPVCRKEHVVRRYDEF